MSAVNGDQSRFDRERKPPVARRKRLPEPLEYAGNSGKPEETSSRPRPRPVSV